MKIKCPNCKCELELVDGSVRIKETPKEEPESPKGARSFL